MKLKKASENCKGEIMVESLIVYSVTLLLLFLILAIFSVLYQRWNIQTIANETATRMAQTYRFSTADASSGYVSKDTLTGISPYRYMFHKSTLESDAKRRMQEYAENRLVKSTFAKSVKDPKCSVDVISDDIGRRHVELSIQGEYAVPFGSVMGLFGFDETISYETKAYAECVDVIDYINFVDFVSAQTNLSRFDSKTISLIDSVLSLFDNILNKD